MFGAVPQQNPVAEGGDAGLQVPLGVEPAEEQGVSGEQGHKGDIVVLGHGVGGGDKPAVVNLLHRQRLLRLLGLHREQRPAAAGHAHLGGGSDEVATVGADVEVQFFHISSFMVVGVQRTGEQSLQPDAQNP